MTSNELAAIKVIKLEPGKFSVIILANFFSVVGRKNQVTQAVMKCCGGDEGANHPDGGNHPEDCIAGKHAAAAGDVRSLFGQTRGRRDKHRKKKNKQTKTKHDLPCSHSCYNFRPRAAVSR